MANMNMESLLIPLVLANSSKYKNKLDKSERNRAALTGALITSMGGDNKLTSVLMAQESLNKKLAEAERTQASADSGLLERAIVGLHNYLINLDEAKLQYGGDDDDPILLNDEDDDDGIGLIKLLHQSVVSEQVIAFVEQILAKNS